MLFLLRSLLRFLAKIFGTKSDKTTKPKPRPTPNRNTPVKKKSTPSTKPLTNSRKSKGSVSSTSYSIPIEYIRFIKINRAKILKLYNTPDIEHKLPKSLKVKTLITSSKMLKYIKEHVDELFPELSDSLKLAKMNAALLIILNKEDKT